MPERNVVGLVPKAITPLVDRTMKELALPRMGRQY